MPLSIPYDHYSHKLPPISVMVLTYRCDFCRTGSAIASSSGSSLSQLHILELPVRVRYEQAFSCRLRAWMGPVTSLFCVTLREGILRLPVFSNLIKD